MAAILNKKSTQKTNTEVLFLQEAFQGVDFFEKMKSEMEKHDLFTLYRQLRLEICKAGESLFNYGN